jgi:LemA protein
MTPLIVLLLVAVIVFWLIGGHNRLIDLRRRFEAAFAAIDVHLKRRYELVPNLVETARGAMKHERETLDAVIQARDAALAADLIAAAAPGDAGAMQALIAAENGLSGSLDKLFALAEAYPDLKANPQMTKLAQELAANDAKMAFARQAFNDAVAGFNAAVAQFPSNLIASLFSLQPAQMLQALESTELRRAARPQY